MRPDAVVSAAGDETPAADEQQVCAGTTAGRCEQSEFKVVWRDGTARTAQVHRMRVLTGGRALVERGRQRQTLARSCLGRLGDVQTG
jgi:hypothetical protein